MRRQRVATDNGPYGCISPDMPLAAKAQAYVDLLLAPSGEAALIGEPAEICAQLGPAAVFDNCTADDLEVLSAICVG